MFSRSIRAFSLGLVVAMLLSIVPAAAVMAGTSAPEPIASVPLLADGQALAVTSPAPGSVRYVPVDRTPSLAWSEGEGLDIEDRRVTQEAGRVDRNGRCDEAEVSETWTHDGVESPLPLEGLEVDTCYRYRVELDIRHADDVVERSGWLRVVRAWTGRVNLYRSGVFSTQRRSSWCVAASVQMMKNIVRNQSDQSFSNQEMYMRSARSLDRYTAGDGAKGSDPRGWAAALNVHGAGTTYADIEKRSFRSAVRAAARALRRTGKPVGLLVGHGSHAWVMTGFTATADPAVTNDFEVTGVYIMGSLHPRPIRHGFDPAPNTRIGVAKLQSRYLTRYSDRLGRSPWDGSFVLITP